MLGKPAPFNSVASSWSIQNCSTLVDLRLQHRMSALGHLRTNRRSLNSKFVRCYPNSGQKSANLICPLSANSDQHPAASRNQIYRAKLPVEEQSTGPIADIATDPIVLEATLATKTTPHRLRQRPHPNRQVRVAKRLG